MSAQIKEIQLNHTKSVDADYASLCAPEVADVFVRLRALKKALRPHLDSNRLAIEMIKVIISEGWDTGPRIVGTMKRLGFDGSHAGATLGKNRGVNPELHHWKRQDDGRYVVLECAEAA